MCKKLKIRIVCLSACVILPSFSNYCLAQEDLGEILSNDVARGADVSALQAEANSFNTIKKGVALSLAMCEGNDLCKPNVKRHELEEIISTLDERIGSIGERYGESGNKDLEGVLLAYSSAKDDYARYLDKLNTMVPEEEDSTEDLFGQSDLFSGFGTPAQTSQFDIFKDAGEEIKDDADVPADSAAPASDQSQ